MKNSTTITRSDFLKLGAASAAGLLATPSAFAEPAESLPFDIVGDHRRDVRQRLKQECRGLLTLPYRVDDGSELIAAGKWAKANSVLGDGYGEGGFIEAFEAHVATLLGFEAACFLPTGVMALLTALRIYADRASTRAVGMHPTSHHILHQEDAHEILHQLNDAVIAPWDRPIQAQDVEAAPDLCAISVEMPVRWIGGQLQTWDELQALKRAAKKRNIPLVMDGARLWECAPYYGRTYSEICEGFDCVFVSMYKIVGGLNGAVLAGDKAFIEETRIWRTRLGGDMYQFFPYVASAAMRLDNMLPRIAGFREQALSLSRRLSAHEKIIALPSDPPTNLFRLILPGARSELMAKRDLIAKEKGIWVGDGFQPTRVPGLSQVELQVGPGYQAIAEEEAVDAFYRLL